MSDSVRLARQECQDSMVGYCCTRGRLISSSLGNCLDGIPLSNFAMSSSVRQGVSNPDRCGEWLSRGRGGPKRESLGPNIEHVVSLSHFWREIPLSDNSLMHACWSTELVSKAFCRDSVFTVGKFSKCRGSHAQLNL